MEDNEVVILYKNKVVSKVFLIVAIMFLLVIFLLFWLAEFVPETTKSNLMSTVKFFMIFVSVFGWIFWKNNKENKNRVFVKENGNVYYGKVLHVYKYRSSKNIYTKLLVEFFDRNEKKLILSEKFPYYIKTNNIDLIGRITKNIDMDEYNYSNKENIIKHIQYSGNGYISFEETKLTKYIIKYEGSRNKNYKSDLTCKVYEYDGKYVVDDIEGYSKKEEEKDNMLALKIFVVLLLIILFSTISITSFMYMNLKNWI